MPGFLRKHPTKHVYYNEFETCIVFVTICTFKRKPGVAHYEIHEVFKRICQVCTFWLVGKYVLMPDHIHFFASPGSNYALEKWVGFLKRQLTQNFADLRWQKECWHHRLRSTAFYDSKWQYVSENPVRAGLVTRSCEWPYQGEIFKLSMS